MVLPTLADISEGVDLVFICSVVGSPPVTFKWYLVGSEQPLNITTANHYSASHSIPRSSKEHSGKYYCEAVNDASNVVKSDQVEIVGETTCSRIPYLTLTSDSFYSGGMQKNYFSFRD